jgi:hypothetical protein
MAISFFDLGGSGHVDRLRFVISLTDGERRM